MMKKIKKVFQVLTPWIFITLLPMSPANAATVTYACGTSGTFTYDNTTKTVTGNTSCVGDVNIPAGALSIGTNAFLNRANLGAVNVPSSVTTIATYAFTGATFTSLNLSEGLTSIALRGFTGSNSRIPLYLPDSLQTIGNQAFENSRFTSVSFGPNVTSFGTNMIYNNQGSAPNSITFRGGSPLIKNIPSYGFMNFLGTYFTFPTGVESITASGFTSSTAKTVILPNSLTSIGATNFGNALQTVVYCGSTSAVQNYTYQNSVVPVCGKALIFEANGGAGSTPTQVRQSAGAISANTYTRTGYRFIGWNTNADGSGTAYQPGDIYSFTDHLVVYAQWQFVDVTAPVIETITAQTVAENLTFVTNVITNESATVSIFGGSDASQFSVQRIADSATALSFSSPPNFENPADSNGDNIYIVIISATDSELNTGYETVTVTITDVVEMPVVVNRTIPPNFQKGSTAIITIGFDSPAIATLLIMDRKIAGCINKKTANSSPYTFTCSFKPATSGSGRLRITFSQLDGGNLRGSLDLGNITIGRRTGLR
jgi:uncharacterized repeat protein (TIGR02543 family)